MMRRSKNVKPHMILQHNEIKILMIYNHHNLSLHSSATAKELTNQNGISRISGYFANITEKLRTRMEHNFH